MPLTDEQRKQLKEIKKREGKKRDTMKPVHEGPEVDHDGSRPGIQAGPSKRAVVWMMTRRAAKGLTALGFDLLAQRFLGIPAGGGAIGYLAVEKGMNESIHRSTGKTMDVDPAVNMLELIGKLIGVIWGWYKSKRKKGGKE